MNQGIELDELLKVSVKKNSIPSFGYFFSKISSPVIRQSLWLKRWQQSDPYARLSVFKNDTDDFLGHVVLGHGDNAGESELAYLFNKSYWKNGYGTEAVTAVVKEYAPATVQEKYTLEGKALEKVLATARIDNPAPFRILEKVGMHLVRKDEKFGAMRNHYSIDLNELQKTSDSNKTILEQKDQQK